LPSNPGVTKTVARTLAGTQQTVTVTLTNAGSTIAFFLRPEITAGNGGSEVVPISYSDNYVSLFPGETTTITATYQTGDLGGAAPFLRVRGVNVPTSSVAVP
jgi:exo-1,4-beta-D-glucosaminidase